MFTDEYSAAIDYYCRIMTKDDVLQLKNLVSRISRAPTDARNYLERHCWNVRGLEEFFKDNSHLFFVINGKVALSEPDELETIYEETVIFFKEKIEEHGTRVNFIKLKTDYWESAPEIVSNFIARFFPGKEFKNFLKSKPDVFIVYEDNTVFLIEVECVEFYKKTLSRNYNEKIYFLRFRGRMSQAKPHIQKYINNYYFGDDFQIFLRRNSHVFVLDEDLNVSLVKR